MTEKTRIKHNPLEFDAQGNPCWGIEMPYASISSPFGYPLPYIQPGLSVVRSRSRRPWLLRAADVLFVRGPIALAGRTALRSLSKKKPGEWGGIAESILQKDYYAKTKFHAHDGEGPTVVGIRYLGPRILPVDVGLLEPVMVLAGLGSPALASAENRNSQKAAFLGFLPGKSVPDSLCKWLDDHGVAYDIRAYANWKMALLTYTLGQTRELSAALDKHEPQGEMTGNGYAPKAAFLSARDDNEAFTAALREWARELAPKVGLRQIDPSPPKAKPEVPPRLFEATA